MPTNTHDPAKKDETDRGQVAQPAVSPDPGKCRGAKAVSTAEPTRSATGTSPHRRDAIREKLAAACHRLNPTPGDEPLRRMMVNRLALLAATSPRAPGTPPPNFSPAGRNTCEKELAALAKAAAKLRKAVEALHEPSLLALARIGIGDDSRAGLPSVLRDIEARAPKADLKDIPPDAGRRRPPDNRRNVIAHIVGDTYQCLTGKRPTFTTDKDTSSRRGPWADFLTEVFAAFGLRPPSDDLVRQVAEAFRTPTQDKAE
jgi:hypothetical protein